MWAAAMKQADSSDPAKVGAVLATMKWTGPLGEVTMREDNHQLLQPMFLSVAGTWDEVHVPGERAGVQDGEPDRGGGAAAADHMQVRWA